MYKNKYPSFWGLLLLFTVFFHLNNQATKLSKEPTVLIVSGWQDVNIGDIAHTPGLLYLMEKRMPKAKLILWEKSRSEKVESLLTKRFPRVKIIFGNPDSNTEVLNAINTSDLLIHGSGPYMVGVENMENWIKLTKKPFGFFGVTFENPSQRDVDVLKMASFIFPRDTESIKHLKKTGVEGKNIIFGPDATFALNLRDETKALEFMTQHELKNKDFLCVVTRFRKSPYWWANPQKYTLQEKDARIALNDKWKYDDNAKLCAAITQWVRTTKKKVVICPEMDYQVKIMDELIISQLPDDVKPFVIKHDYWLPDEAISLYSHAHTLISMECHSVIMALAVGTPAFYHRQPQDTIKGQMFYDLGLDKWVFEIEETTSDMIISELIKVMNDYPKACRYIKSAQDKIDIQYNRSFKFIENIISQKQAFTK